MRKQSNYFKTQSKITAKHQSNISRLNQKLLKEELSQTVQVAQEPGCNCSTRPCPPVIKKCTVDHVIYRAKVKDDNQIANTYTGVTRNTFKKRYYGHNYSFHHRGENSTALSSYLWNLKDQNKNYEISWNIVDRAQEFYPVNRKCRLCLEKKFYIIFQPDGATLNLLPADTDLGFYYRKCTTLEAWPLCHCQQSTARTPTAGTPHARAKSMIFSARKCKNVRDLHEI